MYEKQPIFSLTPEAVSSVDRISSILGAAALVNDTLSRLHAAHPLLDAYTDDVALEVEETQAYLSGVINTYAAVHRQLELDGDVPNLSEDELGLLRFNINGRQLFSVKHDPSERVPDDLAELFADKERAEFLELLSFTSPEFAAKVYVYLISDSFTYEEKLSFLRGVYDTFMPFYKKREAEHLYDNLVWLPDLMAAVKSGYYK